MSSLTATRLARVISQNATRHRHLRPERRRRRGVWCQKGFGEGGKSASTKKTLSYKQLKQEGVLNSAEGWIPVAKMTDLKGSKSTCPVITSTGVAIVLYKVVERPEGPAAECPLDGTTYDLATGKVLEWCPKNNPMRMVLGTLKSREDPKPLGVYDTVVADDGTIFTKLF